MSDKRKHTYLREVEIKYKFKKVESRAIGSTVTNPKAVVKLFADLQNETKEKLIAICLDAKNKIICFEVVALGSVEAIHARPMEIFRTAILVNAHSIIVIHNHPSGDPAPSSNDILFTEKLTRISSDLGLTFYDHIIVGLKSYFSFADERLL